MYTSEIKQKPLEAGHQIRKYKMKLTNNMQKV